MFASLLFSLAILPNHVQHAGLQPNLSIAHIRCVGDPIQPPQFMAVNPDSCNGGDTVAIQVGGQVSSQNQTFYISTSNGSDFSSIPTQVVLPAGSSTVTFYATTNSVSDDPEIEVYNSKGEVYGYLSISS